MNRVPRAEKAKLALTSSGVNIKEGAKNKSPGNGMGLPGGRDLRQSEERGGE